MAWPRKLQIRRSPTAPRTRESQPEHAVCLPRPDDIEWDDKWLFEEGQGRDFGDCSDSGSDSGSLASSRFLRQRPVQRLPSVDRLSASVNGSGSPFDAHTPPTLPYPDLSISSQPQHASSPFFAAAPETTPAAAETRVPDGVWRGCHVGWTLSALPRLGARARRRRGASRRG